MSARDIGGWSVNLDERVGRDSDEIPIYDEGDYIVAACWQMGEDFDGENGDANMKAHAARIVACVNACKGIDPDAVPLLLRLARRLDVALPTELSALIDEARVALAKAVQP